MMTKPKEAAELPAPSIPISLFDVGIDALCSTAAREHLAAQEDFEEETDPTEDPIYITHQATNLTMKCDARQTRCLAPLNATNIGSETDIQQRGAGLQPTSSKPKGVTTKTAPSPANARRRFRRQTSAALGRIVRPKVISKYKLGSTPLKTTLESAKLETTSSSYEAKPERVSLPSRNTFAFAPPKSNPKWPPSRAIPTKNCVDGEGPKTSQDPTPSRDPASLINITNPHIREVLEKMMKEDEFSYKAWDGSTSHPILDALKRVAVVLVAKIDDDGYREATRGVFEELEVTGASAYFSESESKHKRGHFPAVNVGISLGPGGTKPMRVSVGGHDSMMQHLINNKHVQRLASHQDASFKLWQPKLYAHYDGMMAKLRGRNPALRRNFPRSTFASMAFNFPPNVHTHRHRDVRNLPYGMCAVHALGNFDPTAGGHLILWELKLIIEFPPGCMVLLPSATITHSNVPVAQGQKRASITQYTAGALFRHVDNGFTTDAALKTTNKAQFAAHSAARLDRWERGLNMWSKYVDGRIV